jgi:hypothetical protein
VHERQVAIAAIAQLTTRWEEWTPERLRMCGGWSYYGEQLIRNDAESVDRKTNLLTK